MSINVFFPIVGETVEAGNDACLTEAVARFCMELSIHDTHQCQTDGFCHETCRLFTGVGESSEQYLGKLAQSCILLVFCTGVPLCLTVQGIADIQSLRIWARRGGPNSVFAVVLIDAPVPNAPGRTGKRKGVPKALPFNGDGRTRNILKTLCREGADIMPYRHRKAIAGVAINTAVFCHNLSKTVGQLKYSLTSDHLRRVGGVLPGLTL